MPPLHRALPLPEIHAAPMLIRHQLYLDMPRPLDQLLQIHLTRPEAPLRLTARRHERTSQLLRPQHRPHPLPATARRSLQHHRIPNLRRDPHSLVHISQPSHRPRHPRHPRRIRRLPSPCLRPQPPHSTPGGPMNTTPATPQASANSAFSERNPYPGCTASAPARRAISKIKSPRR